MLRATSAPINADHSTASTLRDRRDASAYGVVRRNMQAASPFSIAEGDDAAPVCRRQSKAVVSRSKTSTHDVGHKVLLDTDPDNARQILSHEHDVSLHLPAGCSSRQVLGVADFHGNPALEFIWANGATLEEWMQNVQDGVGPSQRADFLVRVRAAMAITKTLADFHDAGVAYNSLNPGDIVLSPAAGDYVATFVDLSRATIFKRDASDTAGAEEVRAKEADLRSLGKLLHQVMDGKLKEAAGDEGKTADSDAIIESMKKRGKAQLSCDGLPLYLGSLVSALQDTSVCYSDARDAYHDLEIFVDDESGRLGRVDIDEDAMMSRLRLPPDMFYGRQVQMSMILRMFQTSMEFGSPQMALISGCPGSG